MVHPFVLAPNFVSATPSLDILFPILGKNEVSKQYSFSTVAVYKINSNTSVAFLYTKDKQAEKKLGKQHPSQ